MIEITNTRAMTESEYIIWKVETLHDIQEIHPTWSGKTVMAYFENICKTLHIIDPRTGKKGD